jgi:hypothetical protein
MKLLFVLDKRLDAGSIHAVAHYVRAGDEAGHVVALYGHPDPRYPTIRFATDPDGFDYVLFIAETAVQLSGLQLSRFVAAVPRARRAIVDTDGMFSPLTIIDQYDRNHADAPARERWIGRHAPLAGTIVQPTIGPAADGAVAVPFFGYDPALCVRPSTTPKPYGVMYVGHNWWRWREMARVILPALEGSRPRVGAVALIGSWWDAPPSWADYLALNVAFQSDPTWLMRLDVTVRPAVPFTDVIRTMSAATINLMLQRPVLRELRILTAKYFEIFCADTIPLVALDRQHAEVVYGTAGRELALEGDVAAVAAKIADVVDHPARYRERVQAVRCHLETYHSYQCRVAELVDTLRKGRSPMVAATVGAGVERTDRCG